MIHPEPGAEWAHFWRGYTDHGIKNEIGRMMVDDGLLPTLAPHFREGFPFFAIRPEALERHKQGMLYVDYDVERRAFIGPRDDFAGNKIDNRALIEEVEDIVRYVARNREANVFEPGVLEEVVGHRRAGGCVNLCSALPGPWLSMVGLALDLLGTLLIVCPLAGASASRGRR